MQESIAMTSPLAHKLIVLLFGINLLAAANAYFEVTDGESDGKETNENTREIVDQQCRRRLDKLEQSLVPTDLLGWIVFQRRMDGSVDFYRNWNDYVNGFGDISREFWLGLDEISRLMSEGSYELRIDMQDFDGNWRYAYYRHFFVGGDHDKYPITTSGYVGNAGNGFQLSNVQFSTKDRDHDKHSDSCAVKFKGAWWYVACHSSNLNGRYLRGKHESHADGVNWYPFRGNYYSLKFTEMKMRRRASNYD